MCDGHGTAQHIGQPRSVTPVAVPGTPEPHSRLDPSSADDAYPIRPCRDRRSGGTVLQLVDQPRHGRRLLRGNGAQHGIELADFFFGAFDPAGTITIDKLPGAFWIQALSVRVFGIHTWALVLPQVLEGVGAVFALFRAVRRLAGPAAGLVAALLLAASPAIVTLDRGNISDSLMILLLVLAADAASAALTSGRLSHLLLAGLFVGLAFQAKMMEAWLVLPALGAAYLLAAPSPVGRRLRSILVLGVVTGVVSLLWMTAVTLTPCVQPSLCRREPSRFGVRAGVRLQRFRTPRPSNPDATACQAVHWRGDPLSAAELGPSGDRLAGSGPGWMLPAAYVCGPVRSAQSQTTFPA